MAGAGSRFAEQGYVFPKPLIEIKGSPMIEVVVKNLNIYPKKMLKNLDMTNGIFFSQRILLELTTMGFSREEAYKVVQKNALNAWKENSSFFDKIVSDKKVTNKIPVNKLKKLFDFSYHTKKINIIFKRALKK